MIDKELLEKMKREIRDDKRVYLENCNRDPRYIDAAQILFEKYYERFAKLADRLQKYNAKALEFKNKGDQEREKRMWEKALKKGVNTPGSYERLAIIYGKEKDYQKVLEVCKKWFDSPHWTIPNMSATSLRLLNRLEKVECNSNSQCCPYLYAVWCAPFYAIKTSNVQGQA